MPCIHSLCYIEVLKSTLRASVLSEIKKCPFLGGTIIQRYIVISIYAIDFVQCS